MTSVLAILTSASLELRGEEDKEPIPAPGQTAEAKVRDPWTPETKAERAPRRKELRDKISKLRAEEHALARTHKSGEASEVAYLKATVARLRAESAYYRWEAETTFRVVLSKDGKQVELKGTGQKMSIARFCEKLGELRPAPRVLTIYLYYGKGGGGGTIEVIEQLTKAGMDHFAFIPLEPIDPAEQPPATAAE